MVTGDCGASGGEAAGGAVVEEDGADVTPVRRLAAVGFETGVASRRTKVERMRLEMDSGLRAVR